MDEEINDGMEKTGRIYNMTRTIFLGSESVKNRGCQETNKYILQ